MLLMLLCLSVRRGSRCRIQSCTRRSSDFCLLRSRLRRPGDVVSYQLIGQGERVSHTFLSLALRALYSLAISAADSLTCIPFMSPEACRSFVKIAYGFGACLTRRSSLMWEKRATLLFLASVALAMRFNMFLALFASLIWSGVYFCTHRLYAVSFLALFSFAIWLRR